MVTNRIKPIQVAGRTVHQVGMPYHFGTNGLVKGDVVNDLLPISEEPNVRIMETKALLCDIRPGRRPQGKQALDELKSKNGAGRMSTGFASAPKNGHRTTAFLTDSTLCIGCKACEVACKEWNGVSADGFDWSGFSYDNTGSRGALDVASREVRRA